MFLKILLSSSLTIIVAAAFLTDDSLIKISQEKLNIDPNYILPQQYKISITHIEKNILVSNCRIHIQILSPISSIILYSPVKYIGITVLYYSRYSINSEHSISNKKIIPFKPVQSLYNNEKNSVEYIFTNDLSPGYYIIKLVTNITEDIGLKSFYKRGERQWLATYVNTTGIQHMIPHLTESLHISPVYNIIIKHHKNYTVLSNIPLQTIVMYDKDTMMAHFNTFVRPNYFVFVDNRANLSLISGPSESKINVNMWCRMHCAFAHKIVQNITLYLFRKWERLNKFWQINHIAIPDFPENESIINLGLAIYREADVTYIENVDSPARKIKVAYFIAHKVVQECLYYENPFWSLSSGLNEAIVTFLGLYIINEVPPNIISKYNIRMIDLFVVQFQQEFLHFDTEYNTSLYNTLFDISFEHYRYIKGYCILRMFQHMVTEEILWQTIRIYVKDNKPANTFGKVLENFSVTQLSANNFIVMKLIINYWTDDKYYSVLKMTQGGRHGEWTYVLTHNLSKVVDYIIPVTYTTQKHQHFTGTLDTILLSFLTFGLHLNSKEDGWILFNIQQTGYYRINYDIKNWRRIANYLNSTNYMKIHILNRAQIIDDAFHLMITNQLNSIIFWNITQYLSRERDYVAWYPMFKALEYLSNIFLFRESIYSDIKVKMRNLLYDLLDKLEYDEISNEHELTKSLRMEAAKWACNLGGRICIEKAQHKLNRHLEDPENNTLLPWWEEWTYCQGLKILYYSLDIEDSPSNKDSPWWRVYHLGKEKFKPKLLRFLSCPEDSKFIKPYLNLIKNDSTTSIMFLKDFCDEDYINYFLFTIAKHARNSVVLDFILKNLENIRPRQVSEHATFAVIINHVYSIEQLEKISEFAESYRRMAAYLPIYIYISQHISNIQSKIRRRIFEIKCQQDYFQNFVKYQ
ncbi:aminopeptidase N-like isoform X2 [Camponotus floridanus]|uniref:aminopeptidase N-like isoform X2 n=1 Tax=Camponotus floridanus TaxID=104421 RepID=UPI000DC6BDE7|nr:aminopeptidase N-like isoform X2 [Camponotus floridanus]